ncbi:helix-turn-helix domain-containing protein [Dictyobacter arantiisoli]|uniref:AraC family transcriptional regulator n=1 Tax=Dictyobacter arantiisoli TaxID=2014874 RepID=A0A5A5T7U4_9CHLR|nr:helix-turn-helix transcriptional regulator [Dictyobacter arantiisoli]GCF07029.1 AraC family transcriptional regulator [Dictyobacter arantiisoli]
MRTATPIFCEDETHPITQAIHTQVVESAIQTMHTHLHEMLTLEDLASAACLSPSHFHRIFCRMIGIPPGEFLSALRFQEARRLLITTSLSITDICFEVGYTSLGSFTTRFTNLVGLSPRLLRQRAHAFEPPSIKRSKHHPTVSTFTPLKNNMLRGRITAPATFQGTIYIALFPGPIPQGTPVCCTRLHAPGSYLFHSIPDGIYYLRSAAFPVANDLHSSLLPGTQLLVGSNTSPLILHQGQIAGDPDLILHPPRLTDPPLVMGLPLL